MAITLIGALGAARNVAVGALLAVNLFNEFNEAIERFDNGRPVSIEPPFLGGQCEDDGYTIIATAKVGDFTYYFPRNLAGGSTDLQGMIAFGNAQPAFIGKISGFELSEDSQTFFVDIFGKLGGRIAISKTQFGVGETDRTTIKIARVINRNNPNDPCGDISSTVGNNGNGLFGNGFSGSALAAIGAGGAAAAALAAAAAATAAAKAATAAALGSVAAAKAAVAAAAAATAGATTLGGLAAGVAAAVGALADLIDAINDFQRIQKEEEKKEEEEEDLKDGLPSLATSNFGTRSKDGYLSLYPEDRSDVKAIQLNTILREVPQSFGRFFGDKSPNRFIYQQLGYIAFVASNLGVIEVVKIEFPRHAIRIPANAIGIFFHFGLVGNVKIELEGLYEVAD